MAGSSRVHAPLVPLSAPPLQSYAGWQVNQPLFWTGTPPATNATPIDAACGGAGPYYSTRGAAKTWLQVGEDMIAALGAWVVGLQANASLADVVVGLEVRLLRLSVLRCIRPADRPRVDSGSPPCPLPPPQVANEPGLGFGGMEGPIRQLLSDTVPPLQAAFRAGGVAANVTVNFIGPNDGGMGAWLAAQVRWMMGGEEG